MIGIPNEESLAIHVTTSCKFNCYGCFNHGKDQKSIDPKYVKTAIDKLHPKYVIFFGGECVLEPELLRELIDICNCKYVIHTSGLYHKGIKDIYDGAYRIGLTLDSLSYDWLHKNKRFSTDDYNGFLEILSLYRDKISMIHNIYPSHNDKNFYRDIEEYKLEVDNYPYITDNLYQEFLNEFRDKVKISNYVITEPKLRLLIDGTISRDMRGIYNLSHIDKFDPSKLSSYHYNKLPIHGKCSSCRYFMRCFACNTFPSFCKDILDRIDYEPHFCRFSKIYFRYD